METQQAKSHINGTGYGSDHLWVRGDSRQVGSRSTLKGTDYRCARCGETFFHRYDIISDAFEALKRNGVKEHCPAKNPATRQPPQGKEPQGGSRRGEPERNPAIPSPRVKKTQGGPLLMPEDLHIGELDSFAPRYVPDKDDQCTCGGGEAIINVGFGGGEARCADCGKIA